MIDAPGFMCRIRARWPDPSPTTGCRTRDAGPGASRRRDGQPKPMAPLGTRVQGLLRVSGGRMSLVTLEELIDAGVHFGHRCSRWNPKMEPFIHGKRNS